MLAERRADLRTRTRYLFKSIYHIHVNLVLVCLAALFSLLFSLVTVLRTAYFPQRPSFFPVRYSCMKITAAIIRPTGSIAHAPNWCSK